MVTRAFDALPRNVAASVKNAGSHLSRFSAQISANDGTLGLASIANELASEDASSCTLNSIATSYGVWCFPDTNIRVDQQRSHAGIGLLAAQSKPFDIRAFSA